MVRGSKRRRSLRLRGYDYSQPGAYFVTVCTQNRMSLFGRVDQGRMQLNNNGIIAAEKWGQLDERFPEIEIDDFLVMPNHMHGIIVIPDIVGAIHELPLQDSDFNTAIQGDVTGKYSPIIRRQMTLPKVIGFYKMNTAKTINIANDTRGTHVWQRNYYEHIIRNEDSLNRIRCYIQENPIRWSNDPENPCRATL